MNTLADLHFLRPWALWGLAPLLPLLWLAHWHEGAHRRLDTWRERIDAHLLAALTVGAGRRSGPRPIHTLLLALALGCIGLAGPAWQREPTPLLEDRAPLVVALDLSASMDAVDESPTRLERAKLKLRTLLERRQGARTALLVFGSSAHRVLPLGDDPNLLLAYVPDLASGLLPAAPADAPKASAAALALAAGMLEREPTPGSILFLTDGFTAARGRELAEFGREARSEILLLAFGAEAPAPLRLADGSLARNPDGSLREVRLGRAGLEAAAAGGIWLASATADDRDLDAIEARIQRHMTDALAADPAARWRDQGFWFAWPAALLLLLGFRPGWTLRWNHAAVWVLCLATGFGLPADRAWATEPGQGAYRFTDLWASRDQQGRWYFEQARFDEAARRFVDPLWHGIALYRAGDFDAAADAFTALATPQGYYNLGNALARLHRYPEAIAAYDQALATRPDWAEARQNRALVATLLAPDDADDGDEEEGDQEGLDPAADTERRKRHRPIRPRLLDEAEISRLWLERIQLSPAGFLQRRFALEARQADPVGKEKP